MSTLKATEIQKEGWYIEQWQNGQDVTRIKLYKGGLLMRDLGVSEYIDYSFYCLKTYTYTYVGPITSEKTLQDSHPELFV